MRIKQLSLLLVCFWITSLSWAQESQQADTLPTQSGSGHAFLNLDIPKGDFTLNTSGLCGHTVYNVYNEDPELQPALNTRQDQANNLHQYFALVMQEKLQAKGMVNQVATARLEPRLLSPGTSAGKKPVHTLYCPDPSIPTDLKLNIGHGHARLDLSDMTINVLNIESHFAEVFVQYNKKNRMPMEKMHIKAIQGKIVVKNLEQARAELVTIENEMDLTKVMIGDGKPLESTVYIQQGMGDCALYIHPGHPLRLIVKEGMFGSASDLPADFETRSPGQYVNQAWKAREAAGEKEVEGTTIICTLDMGKLRVISMR